MSDRDDELATAAADLEASMRDLRRDLERRAPRGPLGLPRPPTPGEFLRFADEAAIPALVAVLEANIRVLEALQKAIRLADGSRELRDRGAEAGADAAAVGARTLERLDDALAEFQRVAEERGLPENEAAREVLQEARTLRAELDQRVRAATDRADASRSRERLAHDRSGDDAFDSQTGEDDDAAIAPGSNDDSDADTDSTSDVRQTGSNVEVDVDAELESIKRQYGSPEDGEANDDEADGEPIDEADDDQNDTKSEDVAQERRKSDEEDSETPGRDDAGTA